MAADYGDATIRRHADGRIEVKRADPTIGISLAPLADCDGLVVDGDGCLLLAGDRAHRYRPVRFATSPGRVGAVPEVIICERVED